MRYKNIKKREGFRSFRIVRNDKKKDSKKFLVFFCFILKLLYCILYVHQFCRKINKKYLKFYLT